MKKLAAIFFLTVYLFSTTEAGELLKLPVIFQHFAEHKKENGKISFLQFLDLHYMHGSPKDKDYARDMQLPFKALDHYAAAICAAFVPLQAEVSIQPDRAELVEQTTPLRPFHFIPTGFHSLIWQPPRC